jgi:SAM-dependent methyltransferase
MTSSVVSQMKCAVCGGNRLRPVLQRSIADFIAGRRGNYDLRSLGLSGAEIMGYTQCEDCSFIFASPTLASSFETATYNDAKAAQADDKRAWLADENAGPLYQTHHKWVDLNPFLIGLGFHFQKYQRPHNPAQRRLRLLDVGCGFGHTLELARVFGLEGTGCDIDQSRLAACRAKGLHAVEPGGIEGDFDIVVSSNVIEHVYDLSEYVDLVRRHLARDGVYVFSGLEKSVIAVELRKKAFKLLHPIEHRNILTRGSLARLLRNHNLRLVTRGEIWTTMRLVRSKAPLYVPYWATGGFVALNGVFTAIARHE